MSVPRENPLYSLVKKVIEGEESGELPKILEVVLRGVYRPPLSDPDDTPTDLIIKVLQLVPYAKRGRLRKSVIHSLSILLMDTVKLVKSKEKVPEDQLFYLKEQLTLAAYLPRSKKFWDVLLKLDQVLGHISEQNEDTNGLLTKALVYHQNDRHLFDRWKRILCDPQTTDWWFKQAWHGITWLPSEDCEDRDYVPIDEINSTLLNVDKSLKDKVKKRIRMSYMIDEIFGLFTVPPEWWPRNLQLEKLFFKGSETLKHILYDKWPKFVMQIIKSVYSDTIPDWLKEIDISEIENYEIKIKDYAKFMLKFLKNTRRSFIIVSDTLNPQVYCNEDIIEAIESKIKEGVVFNFLCGKYLRSKNEGHKFLEYFFKKPYKENAIFYIRTDRPPALHYKIIDNNIVIIEAFHSIGASKRKIWVIKDEYIVNLLINKFEICLREGCNMKVDNFSDYKIVQNFPELYKEMYLNVLNKRGFKLTKENPEAWLNECLKMEYLFQKVLCDIR